MWTQGTIGDVNLVPSWFFADTHAAEDLNGEPLGVSEAGEMLKRDEPRDEEEWDVDGGRAGGELHLLQVQLGNVHLGSSFVLKPSPPLQVDWRLLHAEKGAKGQQGKPHNKNRNKVELYVKHLERQHCHLQRR